MLSFISAAAAAVVQEGHRHCRRGQDNREKKYCHCCFNYLVVVNKNRNNDNACAVVVQVRVYIELRHF